MGQIYFIILFICTFIRVQNAEKEKCTNDTFDTVQCYDCFVDKKNNFDILNTHKKKDS